MDWRRFTGLVRARQLKAPKLRPLPELPSEQVSRGEQAPQSPPEWNINPDLFRSRVKPEQPA